MSSEPFSPHFQKRGGLLPAIVQDSATKQVLMLGWMNEVAWKATLSTARATFWSTSRNELWVKGATSGNQLHVEEIRIDCDDDTILLFVRLEGSGACHTKNAVGRTRVSCFFRSVGSDGSLLNLDP